MKLRGARRHPPEFEAGKFCWQENLSPPGQAITLIWGVINRGAGELAAPNLIPARLLGASAPSNRIREGHIGCGRIGRDHDMPNGFHSELADIVAVCDLDARCGAGSARWTPAMKNSSTRSRQKRRPEPGRLGVELEGKQLSLFSSSGRRQIPPR